jgi:membrane protein implicated in regulation of membrane protease activity
MSRTRIVFFIILALYVAVLAFALASDLAGAQFLRGLFIASTVFAAGVVALDMFGVFGEHHGDTAGDVTAGHIGDHFGHAAEGGAPAGHAHAEGGAPAAGDASGNHAADHSHEAADSGHHEQSAAAPILSVLMYLRLFVYFCLGFGPVGWLAVTSGRGTLVSLLMATVVGVGAVFLAQAFFRFQRHDTDSQVHAVELVGQRATVIIPLDDKTMGKVRVQMGLVVTEQYALAAHAGAAFQTGDEVLVASVTDECVYVR